MADKIINTEGIMNDSELAKINGGSSVLPDKFVDGEGTVTRKYWM